MEALSCQARQTSSRVHTHCHQSLDSSPGSGVASKPQLRQSLPNSSMGCWVRSEPFPQASESVRQYLSQPQQIRSGFAGSSGNFFVMSRTCFLRTSAGLGDTIKSRLTWHPANSVGRLPSRSVTSSHQSYARAPLWPRPIRAFCHPGSMAGAMAPASAPAAAEFRRTIENGAGYG